MPAAPAKPPRSVRSLRQPAGAEARLRERLGLEAGLAACARILLAPGQEAAAPGVLPRALKALARGAGLSRAAVYLNQDDPEAGPGLRLVADSAGAGRRTPQPARPYASLGLGRWAQALFRNRPVHGLSAAFPEAERGFLEDHGPVATALLPLRQASGWAGFLRLDRSPEAGAFAPEDLELFGVAAGLAASRLERERTESSLRLGAEALRGMVEHMPVLVAAFGAEGRLVFWNRECERVSGWTAAEVLHTPQALDRLFPEGGFAPRPRAKDFLSRELPLTCRDGSTRTIAWSDVSRRHPLPGWRSWRIGVDLSSRAHTEALVIRAKREWERTFDSVPDCVLLLDQDLRVRRLNLALGERLGAHPRELIGRPLPEILEAPDAPGEGARAAELLAELSACETCSARELSIPRWGGQFLVTVSPFVDADDVRLGSIVVAHDISGFKALEEELARSQRLEALGTLAGGIAHDFNNILGVILGYAEMMQAQALGPSQEGRLREIVRAGVRAKELVGQILAFSRQGQGRLLPLRLTPLVKEVLQQLLVTMPAGVSVRRRFDTQADTVLADPGMLHQVASNLCANAVQAMPSGGVLEVGVEEVYLGAERGPELAALAPGTYVLLRVRDTGPGIPPEILDRIFDPFFTTKRPGEGTGMGLAVVHGIVHRLGGAIRAESQPGAGATMRVYLPRVRAAADETA